MSGEDFETLLREDLPRGLREQEKSGGRERGLFARWLTPSEMSGKQWNPEVGLLLGRRDGRLVGWDDDRHVMTIAGTRAGKGTSLIIPNLFLYKGSALVLDPKGENAEITAARRGKGAIGVKGLGQEVHVLDPFGVSGITTSCFNPIAELEEENLIDDAGMFADALIIHPEKGERHWSESAQALLRALILLVWGDEDPERRNLVTVRRLLTLTDKKIGDLKFKAAENGVELDPEEALIQLLKEQTAKPYGYVCAGIAEQLKAMSEKERGSVLSTARTQTQWLDSAKVQGLLTRSDFELADLKRKKMTVYLCLPAMRMGTHARWFRLMILLALSVMERTRVRLAPGEKTPPPVLFVLDEFPVLGHMQAIETAAGLMAGFGVKLWTIIQNVGQLKQHYGDSWETFFANSGLVTAFDVSDELTLDALSKKLGRTEIIVQHRTNAVGLDLTRGMPEFREEREHLPLLAQHEIQLTFPRGKKRILIVTKDGRPAIAERLLYHDEPMFERMYKKEPRGQAGDA